MTWVTQEGRKYRFGCWYYTKTRDGWKGAPSEGVTPKMLVAHLEDYLDRCPALPYELTINCN